MENPEANHVKRGLVKTHGGTEEGEKQRGSGRVKKRRRTEHTRGNTPLMDSAMGKMVKKSYEKMQASGRITWGSSPVTKSRLSGLKLGCARPSPNTHSRTVLAPLAAKSLKAASKNAESYPCPHAHGP
jgi:hypothetical protein